MDKTDLLKSRIGMKLVRVGKMVRAIANQKFVKANYEITPEQFTVLTAILDHDGLYQRQIGAITLKDRPNITRIINILENKELVTRTPDTNKRKVFKINITEKGKKEYETVLPTVIEHWQDSVSGVSDEELTNCLNVLNKIKENLEEYCIETSLSARIKESHFELENVIDFLKASDLSKTRNLMLLHLSDKHGDSQIMKERAERATGIPVLIADKKIEMNL